MTRALFHVYVNTMQTITIHVYANTMKKIIILTLHGFLVKVITHSIEILIPIPYSPKGKGSWDIYANSHMIAELAEPTNSTNVPRPFEVSVCKATFGNET